MHRDRSARLSLSPAFLLPILLVAVSVAAPARAGSIPLAWDPVNDPDLVSYRVYYGTSPGSYGSPIDVGNTTEYTLTGLDDCTRYYVAVKAWDGQLESDAFSNELVGLPTPSVSSTNPTSGEQGQTLTVSVAGASFDTGAVAEFSHAGITVNSTSYVSCNELEVSITIASGASPGMSDVDVVNPDQSFGSRASAFEVTAASAPTVNSTSPADGASDVAITVKPTVTFSEPMDATSITTGTVRLLDPTGTPVAQAAGSPALDGTGTVATITPAADLDHEATYQINVTGGPSGVKDAMGTAMSEDYLQNPGFTTGIAPDTQGPVVVSTDPANGALGVALNAHPVITFDEELDPATVNSDSVQLLDPAGNPVPQAGGSPTLDATGTLVTIIPANDLDPTTYYRIKVAGRGQGVKDTSGNPMDNDYVQDPGFETLNEAPSTVTGLRRRDTR